MISYEGFNEKILTFPVAAKIEKGTFVTFSSNGCVRAVSEDGDEDFFGVVIDSDSKFAAVQVSGFYEAPTTDTIPLGYTALSSTGTDIISGEESTILRLVIQTGSNTVGILL